MKKGRPRRVKPLFFRILASIAVPLAILLFAFAFVLLKREFEMQERHFHQEGKMAMERFHHEFTQLVEDPSILRDRESLEEQIEWIKKRLEAVQMDVVDPVQGISILAPKFEVLSIKNKRKERWSLTKAHQVNIQKSLALKREKIPYHISIVEEERKLYGYLPFQDTEKNRMFVAVAQFKLSDFRRAIQETQKILTVVLVLILFTAFLISFRLTIRIIRPLQAINRACREMLAGKLGHQVKVKTGDELELLANNFNKMSHALLIMTHRAEDSNPLTGLPGNRLIAAEVAHRIHEGKRFVFFHIDIDHFKAYNDQFGLSKGDEVLRDTMEVVVEVTKEFEGQDIFVGHQGGDDFVLISAPAQGDQIANAICKRFDAGLKKYFSEEDLRRGYYVGEEDRPLSLSEAPEMTRHPLMSISVAGVSNVNQNYQSFDEILERAVHVKKRAKKIPYSVHLIDE